jgi:hypothetical protein
MFKEADKPTKKWLKMGEVYKFFAKDFTQADFSDKAKLDMFKAESYGGEYNFEYRELRNGKLNGYAVGKHLMDIQLAMWQEDLSQFGQLTRRELMIDEAMKPIRGFLMEWFGWTQDDIDHLTNTKLNDKIQISSQVYKYIRI